MTRRGHTRAGAFGDVSRDDRLRRQLGRIVAKELLPLWRETLRHGGWRWLWSDWLSRQPLGQVGRPDNDVGWTEHDTLLRITTRELVLFAPPVPFEERTEQIGALRIRDRRAARRACLGEKCVEIVARGAVGWLVRGLVDPGLSQWRPVPALEGGGEIHLFPFR